MRDDRLSRITLAALFTCFTIIRAHYRRSARPRSPLQSDGLDVWVLRILIPFEVATLFTYLFLPRWLAWAILPLPTWMRWVGAILGLVALLSFVRVHRSLGPSFSSTLQIGAEQRLVTNGPYRRVRHPMYTAFYVLHLAAFLLMANWFIGVTWIGGLTLVIASRVRREEGMMIERFGQEYRSYMQRTGRFFSPLR